MLKKITLKTLGITILSGTLYVTYKLSGVSVEVSESLLEVTTIVSIIILITGSICLMKD